jgi:hypothetical protein
MQQENRISDQYYDWSDKRSKKSLGASPQTETQAVGEQDVVSGDVLARFVDRALQALRQAGMQMLDGTGARAKVLPLRQSGGIQTTDGLRALRVPPTGTAVCGELSTRSQVSQGNLRNQSRTIATKGTTLDRIRECHRHSHAGGLDPTGPGCRSGRQHAPGFFLATTAQAARGGKTR